MARFALFTNGVKVETLDELRENFNIKDMLENFETKALHRWLAVNHYPTELASIESMSLDVAKVSLMDTLGLSENQKDSAKCRENQRILAIENRLKQEAEKDNAQQIQDHLYKKNHISLATLGCNIVNVEKMLHGKDFIVDNNLFFYCETDKKFYWLNDKDIFVLHDSLNNLEGTDHIASGWIRLASKDVSRGSIITFDDKYILLYDKSGKWRFQECFWLKNKSTFFNFDRVYGIVPSANQTIISLSQEDGKCTLCHLDTSEEDWILQSRTSFEDKDFAIDEMVLFHGVYIAATSKTGSCGNGKINTFHSIFTSEDCNHFNLVSWSQEAPHTFWSKHLFSFEEICFATVSDCTAHYTLDGRTWLTLEYKFEKIFKYKDVYFADVPLGNQKRIFTSNDGVQWKKLIDLENIDFRGICDDKMVFHDYYPQDKILIARLEW